MKKTNPVLAGLAAVALTATLVPAFALAAEGTTPDTKSTTVKYTVEQSYEWSVPSDVTFAGNADSKTPEAVKVTNNVIPNGMSLYINLGTDPFEIMSGIDQRTYTVTDPSGKQLAPGANVLAVPSGKSRDEKALTFNLDRLPVEKAGTYTGTLTYEAKIEPTQGE